MKSILPLCVIAGIVMLAMMHLNWSRIENRDAEFAKACNEKGLVAKRIDEILQCVSQ